MVADEMEPDSPIGYGPAKKFQFFALIAAELGRAADRMCCSVGYGLFPYVQVVVFAAKTERKCSLDPMDSFLCLLSVILKDKLVEFDD